MPIKEEREQDAEIIRDEINFEISKAKSEFDFWSMYRSKIMLPHQLREMQRITREDVNKNVAYWRDRVSILKERKQRYDVEGYALPKHEDDTPHIDDMPKEEG